jgi:CIC family chloride channel protein
LASALPSQRFERFFPFWMRAFVRARESGLVIVALCIGVISGTLVALMGEIAQFSHEFLFGLARGERLSVAHAIVWWRLLSSLIGGAILLSLFGWWAGQRFKNRLSDAIEANALQGGRLSFGGSLYITFQTMISNACGASVGLEAAYTQICSAIASFLGRGLAARRADMRLLVGCGAAGAIAAAFGAPLSGAFYAFEVVLGAYAVSSLVPVVASAVAASAVAGFLSSHNYLITAGPLQPVSATQYAHIILIASICTGASILVMLGVAQAERIFSSRHLPVPLRPIIGALLVWVLGMMSTRVLAAGHGALQANLVEAAPLGALAAMILLKGLASSISLGSGFRGGLFFASLLLGGLVGRLYSETLAVLTPFQFDAGTAAIAGMAALGTGVIGAPITMTVLALETTGDFSITVAALVASAIAALVVRETFGYSFATWRFHLRGETIRGPHDIGWMRDMKVARLMLKDVRTVPSDATIAAARDLFPVGSVKQAAVVDEMGRYVGLLITTDLQAAVAADLDKPVTTLARAADSWLLPDMNVRQALDLFEKSEADALSVLDAPTSRRPIGILTEAHALRRYGEELERRNRALVLR